MFSYAQVILCLPLQIQMFVFYEQILKMLISQAENGCRTEMNGRAVSMHESFVWSPAEQKIPPAFSMKNKVALVSKKKSFNFAKRLFHYVCMWIASIKSGWDVGFKNHKWWCLYASVPLYLATCFFSPPTFHLLNPLEFTHWSVMEKGFDGSPLFNCNEKLYSSFLYSLSTLFFHFIRSIKIMMRINDEKSAGETALNLIHLVFDAKRILCNPLRRKQILRRDSSRATLKRG